MNRSARDEAMPLRGAIIGFGHIAANGHVPAYLARRDIRIVAVCDSSPGRKKLNDQLLRGSRFYSSAEDMLEREDVDFVDVSTPPALHAPFILRALETGRHVLCEKPLILDVSHLERILGAMEQSGCTVVTVHNWRYSPIMQKLTSLVRQGAVGKIEYMEYEVIRTQPSVAVDGDGTKNWRLDPSMAGGGILVDHGWHAFYLVNEWARSIPVQVECKLENRKFDTISVEDTAEVIFDYSDLRARLFFTWAGKKRSNFILIRGDGGEIRVLDDTIIIQNNRGTEKIEYPEGLSAGSHHPEWYGLVLEELLAEMKNKSLMGRNFAEAANCFNLLDHCKKSSSLSMPVDVKHW